MSWKFLGIFKLEGQKTFQVILSFWSLFQFLDNIGKIIMYGRKIRGLKVEPWKTPALIGYSYKVFLWRTIKNTSYWKMKNCDMCICDEDQHAKPFGKHLWSSCISEIYFWWYKLVEVFYWGYFCGLFMQHCHVSQNIKCGFGCCPTFSYILLNLWRVGGCYVFALYFMVEFILDA